MDVELLRLLTSALMASSVAIPLVGLLRKPLRAAFGSRTSYWVWLLVPALVLACLLPAPSQMLQASSGSLTGQIRSALSVVAVTTLPRDSAGLATVLLAIWAVGACAMIALLASRQRSFVRSLGKLTPDPGGFHRAAVAAPMLLGAWRPRIVVPFDFEFRYSKNERALVLAHERAHMERFDTCANAIASAWLCVFWFNPLIHWAMRWLRIDQELACDALVLAQREDARHCYAKALLKTQLATDCSWRLPVGCHWQSSHSLKERILMLKRPLPGTSRQRAGIALVIALAACGGYTAWAGQMAEGKGAQIVVDMKVNVTNTQSNEVFAVATRYLVHSGETPSDMKVPPAAFVCTPYLHDELEKSSAWAGMKARGLPMPPVGYILMDCTIREEGQVVSTPAVMALDGQPALIETSTGLRTYRMELNASTSADRIAAASSAR